jgi:S1-C subfamily serine protease
MGLFIGGTHGEATLMTLRTMIMCGLVFFGIVGCASTTSTAIARVTPGMSTAQVSALLGSPDSRSFRDNYEAWQYADVVGFGQCEYITIFIASGVVRSMTSRRGSSVAGCGLGSAPVDWSQMRGSPQSSGGIAKQKPAEPPQSTAVSGSCFFVSQDGLIITNHHVIEGKSSFLILDHQNKEFPAQLLKIDPANDLAVLKAEGVMTNPLSFASFGSLSAGDEIFSFGYPLAGLLGEEPKFTDGVVSSTTGLAGASNVFQMTVPIQPGNSGGPIVNYQGQVVGVATSTAAVANFLRITGTLPQNINWAVKGEYAQILAGIEPTKAAVLSRNQAIESTRKAICRIVAE